jgi:molybdopterin converting factor small subunit
LMITVIYTLPFRERAGVKEETFEIEGDSPTVKELLNLIVGRHPSMSEFVDSRSEEAQRRQLVVAVNSRLAKLSDSIHDGDRVSLLLPVIGGSRE